MLRIKAESRVFKVSGIDWTGVGIPGNTDVEVHLGINPAFTRQLVGTGKVPCWCVARNAEGRCPGMASSPGFVLGLDFDELRKAGAPESSLWVACGANKSIREGRGRTSVR